MAYKYREEIVGKRFLSVSRFTKLKLGKIGEWGWRAGVIRAASHKDSTHPDLQVLVEYDGVEWHRREWISIYKDSLFHLFLVEHSLVWTDRVDPLSPSNGPTVLWPALSFTPLVAVVDMATNQQPLEFLLDRELAFRDYSRLQPFQEWDPKLPGLRDYPELRAAVRRWSELQDGQRILVTTPSVLVGYRVEVYRAEGTTQWYTAVIVSYNEATRDLTVTDDTVLEEHNEDPCIVQMRLIGDGVVESIMRGENVGITPRRSRSSAVLTQQQQQQPSRVGRGTCVTPTSGSSSSSSGGSVAITRSYNTNTGAAPVNRKPRIGKLPPSGEHPPPSAEAAAGPTAQIPLEKGGSATNHNKTKSDRKRKNAEAVIKPRGNSSASDFSNKEDLENKGNKKRNSNRGSKKKVLEEANNSKLRCHVQVRVEDCLHRTSALRSCKKDITSPHQVVEISPARDEALSLQSQDATDEPKEQEEAKEAVLPDQEGDNKCVVVNSRTRNKEEVSLEPDDDRGRGGSRCSVVLDGKVSENEEKCNSGTAVQEEVSEPSVIVEDRTSSGDPVVRQPATSSQDDDDGPLSSSSPFSRMEIDSSATALLRFPDDRSDSGVSSLRSGSGDERSGSRSSALSSSDEPPQQQNNQLPPPLFLPSASNPSSSDKLTTTPQEPVRVWRDPSLLLVAEPHVRHINSVQHQTLLMSHPPPAAATAPSSSSAPAVVSQAQALALAQAHYPPVVPPPPPLLSPHPLHHHPHAVPHHLPPPGLYSQLAPDMLWNKRYPPLPVGTHLLAPAHPAPEDILVERERERVFRERQNQEARELEKQHKEREKERERAERERLEREKLERERQERQEREKMERERQERIEQERQEQERIEKQRAAQAVHQHFEESFRLAQQKRSNMCWTLFNSLPPSRGTGTEEERKRANEHDVTQQQRLMAERLRQERYYPPGRPPSVPKVEYPPPAHSRVTGGKTSEKSASHTVLPKVEPTFNLFGYPTYHHGLLSHDISKVKQEQLKGSPSAGLTSLVTTKSASSSSSSSSSSSVGLDRERDLMLPNPPPLMSDIKNSVIVKNEGKSPHHPHDSSKAPPSHSPSPKIRAGDMVASQQPHYLPQTSLTQHKAAYEYRSPTQSPHHLAPRHTPSPHHAHMALEPQNLAGKGLQVHHRSSQQSSPHTLPHRQSPHTMQQQQPHPSPPEQRYSGSSGPSSLPYGSSKTATVGSYPYPSPVGHVTTTHYPLATGVNVTAASKPKVSSPAPPHIYGKPGITTGTPVCRAQDTNVSSGPLPLTSKAPLTSSVSPSPYQQMSPHHHHPPPPHQTPAGPPPPAHSRVNSSSSSMVGEHRGLFDRMYPGGTSLTVKPHSQHQGSSPPSASAAPLTNPHSSPLQIPHHTSGHHLGMTPVFQTQPLDLGVSSERGNNRDDLIGSPKRKGLPMHHSPCIPDSSKKRRCDQSNLTSQQVMSQVTLAQPLLSRVSEPSPLIASAATPITTVVNTAAYCTPAASSMMVSLSHDPLPGSATVTTSPNTIPARTGSGDGSVRSSSPGVTAVCPTTGSSRTQQQSNSPVPFVPPASSSSPNLAAQQHTNTTHTPVKPQPPPSNVDSDKSNSPGPVRPTTGSGYPVHKLKKAWLQRHSGEDGTEDTTGIVGSGSCVTLPLNLGTNSSGTGISKDNNSSGGNNMSSLQTVLSCKGKPVSNKGSNRKGPPPAGSRDVSGVTLNGHATDIPSSKHSRPDDSSSSDPEHKSPPKRKPPKMKRKKGGGAARKAAEEKRKKMAPVAVHSESGSDSDKESLSDKDSDSGASTTQSGTSGKKSANGGSGNGTSGGGGGSKEPRKRGRRPKSSKNDRGEEPRQKKPRDDPPAPQRDPFHKPPISQLKKTGESFLQDGPCHEVAPKLAKCRECRWTPNQRSKNMPNIFCRFYAFRRLRYTKNGQLAIAGFSDPHRDAAEEDLKLWLPLPDSPPADLDLEMSRFLLTQVGDQFCDLLEQEKESIAVHMSEEKTIAWKRVVQGVREMCDVCETTLFNFHWACSKCGFVVCIDCYKGRKNGSIKIWGEAGKDRDEFSWLLCTNRQAHEQEKLMLTQIIAGDSLLQLGRKVHDVRALCCIPQYCGCPMSKENPHKSTNGICKDLLKIFKNEPLNGIIKQEKKEKDTEGSDKEKKNVAANGSVVKQEDQNSPLNWLADVALSSEDKKPCEDSGGSSSDSDEDKDGNYSTLRELLIRPSHKPNGSGSRSASPANNSTSSSGGVNSNNVCNSASSSVNSSGINSSTNSSGTSSSASPPVASATSVASVKGLKKSRLDTLDEVISSVIEHSVQKDDHHGSSVSIEGKPPIELKHFVRRYNWAQKGREPLPIRIMTLTESKILYPDVPHSWLCDGKLLRLNDPNCEGNYRIFQDQWKRGQPVIVSDVTKHLDMSLWHPDSFARDFGEDKNDLINCMTGNLVPNQPMRKFWEGFEHFSRRLKDDRGNPMLLKLKDWPPGEDFAEMLPSRFSDLMRVLPLAEYTHRTGRLNLASRLPECFVRPDLGPKMYNAYGSALYPTKGTTNLHLDISDAVNVMVYVGIPKDGDNDEHIKEAFRAIDEAGCDILTRRRVREKGELPGALWHIYNARDADKIRDLLNKVAIERGARLEPHHDPIHDQSWYLDGPLRERLYKEYGVEGYAIVQCLGDSVFIPAGAPHQVRNLHNCIKVAEDFVSPENVSHCFHLTQEFRELSDTHSNHEDKLQIKNIIYHAVKDSLSVLTKMAGGNEEILASLVSGPAAADNGTNISGSGGGEPTPPNGSSELNDEDANNSSHSNVEIKTDLVT